MKPTLLHFAGTLLLSTAIGAMALGDTRPADMPLQQIRVMSYNIHHCNPPGKPDVIDVDAIAAVINSQKPDIVALQEVDVHTRRSGPINEAELLAEKTGMHAYFAKSIDFSGGDFGNAILSRSPIRDAKDMPLPSQADLKGEPRVLATVRIKLLSGFEYIFAATHLDSTDNETNRLLQVEAIRKATDPIALPIIIAGDFNATPDSATIGGLDQSFQRTDRDGEWTYPADTPVKTIDYIAYRSAGKLSVVSQNVVAETEASDHRPTLCVFQVNE